MIKRVISEQQLTKLLRKIWEERNEKDLACFFEIQIKSWRMQWLAVKIVRCENTKWDFVVSQKTEQWEQNVNDCEHENVI